MTDYTELVKFLRGLSPWAFPDASKKRMNDAAAAIEALETEIRESMQKCAECGDEQEQKVKELQERLGEAENSVERWKDMYLTKHEPKRGEWIYHPKDAIEMMFTLPKCSICGHESSDALNYCPNCGAKMNDSNASNALNALDNAQDGPIITPCRGCSDYDGYGGCKSKGGCARAKMEVQDADTDKKDSRDVRFIW